MSQSKAKFKALQKKWYGKLAKAGFEDIEYAEGKVATGIPKRLLKNKPPPEYVESVLAYYRLTSVFLHEHEFKTETEKIIWEYYSNGLTVREISKLLKDVNLSMPYQTVWWKIKQLENIMKARYL